MAIILDGKKSADNITENLKTETDKLQKKPKLAVIAAGDNPASMIYVRNKQKKAHYIGFDSLIVKLSSEVSEETILEHINALNKDTDVNAILVQLPLPKQINTQKILEAIDPVKDADGFTSYNFGKLALGYKPYVFPCTPKGIIKLLEEYNIEIESRIALVIGRSNIAGKPVSLLLQRKNATVIMAHSYTKNLKELSKNADILISAAGNPEFIDSSYIKPHAVVIDVGINRTEKGIRGDVDFMDAINKAAYITPVPGGIGPMTIAMLMENTFELYKIQTNGKK